MAASQHRVSLALACHVFYSAGSAIAIIGVGSTGAPGAGAPLYYFLRACVITKHGSSLYIGMAKVLPIIDVLGYDGQNFSFSSSSFTHNSSRKPYINMKLCGYVGFRNGKRLVIRL